MANSLIAGAVIMGLAVAGLFFLRFWSRTRDRLFLFFGAAFWLLALNRALVATLDIAREDQSWVYVLRLIAFCLIIAAILIKNAEAKRSDPPRET
jgi:hypothetical protein